MHRHRLQRLAQLTTGAALVGASALAGCKEEPKTINAPEPTVHANATAEPIHINAPPDPTPTPSATASANAPPSASARQIPMHTINAPPTPIHVNAPPK